ncbi:MAG: DciA family protein [Acidimicrobiia bacterium]
MNDEPRPIQDSVRRVRNALRMEDPRRLLEVANAWSELVGPQLAEHTWPVAIKDGVLLVEVDDNAWMAPLRYLEDTISSRVGDDVERVKTRLRNGPTRPH